MSSPIYPKQPGALFSRLMFWLKLNFSHLQLIEFQAPAGHIHDIAIGHLFSLSGVDLGYLNNWRFELNISGQITFFSCLLVWCLEKAFLFPKGGEKCGIYYGRIRKKLTKKNHQIRAPQPEFLGAIRVPFPKKRFNPLGGKFEVQPAGWGKVHYIKIRTWQFCVCELFEIVKT